MTQPGGRDFGGNSSVVASPSQAGQTAVTATGGPVSGVAVEANGTGTGAAVKANASAGNAVSATTTGGVGVAAFSSTGIAVSATSAGTVPAVLATNVSGGEALKVAGDAASTTAALAPLLLVPLQNQPSGTHAIGHMYVTAAGKLMICTSAGTPGTWTIVGTQS